MIILLIILHLILMFGAVVMCKVAESKDIIEDAEFPMVVAIFVPLGVVIFVGALWVGVAVSNNLS